MKMFKCELINEGIVIENFFREGESAAAVREQLKMFEWPDGKWVIEEV